MSRSLFFRLSFYRRLAMDMKKMLAEEREEMLRDKYIESEKAGYDLGDRQMVT